MGNTCFKNPDLTTRTLRQTRLERRFLPFLLIGLLIVGMPSAAQRHRGIPRLPQPAVPDVPAPATNPPPKVNPVQLEREARELSDLAATVPGDVDKLKKGLLPKDVIDKLKRIEKLSKTLRNQITN